MEYTPIALLKAFSRDLAHCPADPGALIGRIIKEKSFSFVTVRHLVERGYFIDPFFRLCLRTTYVTTKQRDNTNIFVATNHKLARYVGTPNQNILIDTVLSQSSYSTNRGEAFGVGAAAKLDRDAFDHLPYGRHLGVPILILGGGPAGAMTFHALQTMHFRNVVVVDKTGNWNGIWRQRNVFNRSRNNPLNLKYIGSTLLKAPGDGLEVVGFLNEMHTGQYISEGHVKEIIPNNFNTIINFYERESVNFPIVINALGLGTPRPLSSSHVSTNITKQQAGVRWQQELNPASLRGKRLLLVGLGNSTAEMLTQIQAAQDHGIDVDYRVLTHYSQDALWNPKSVVSYGKPVFRNLSLPDLTGLTGDLPEIRKAYFRALHQNKILSDLTTWTVKENECYVNQRNRKQSSFKYDAIYTLIGYRTDPEKLKSYGITVDKTGAPLYHYDGEFVDSSNNPIKGYFGIGAILETPWNKNAVVIPGMIHRLGDLLFSVYLRAVESLFRE